MVEVAAVVAAVKGLGGVLGKGLLFETWFAIERANE